MRDWLKKHDVLNKLLAVFLSIVLWFIIMDRINPDVSITFHDVKVTIKGETELLTAKKYSIISNKNLTVDVTLRGKRNVIMGLRKTDIEVVADVSQITGDGESQILCTVNTPDESITVVDRNRLRVTVEADIIDEEEIPLRVMLNGEPAAGYRVGELDVGQDTVTVRGARKEVSRIAFARALVNIGGSTEDVETSVPIEFIDHAGNVMELKFTQSTQDKLTVNVPVLFVKELTLVVTLVPGGGLTAAQVEPSIIPNTITVMGPKSILDDIEYVSLGTVDLDGVVDKTPPIEKPIATLPVGVKVLSGQATATVTVTVKNIEVRNVDVRDVRFIGELPGGLSAVTENEAISIRLRGNRDLLNSIDADDLDVAVNLSDIGARKAGTVVTVPAVVSLKSRLNVDILGEYTVDVKIIKP